MQSMSSTLSVAPPNPVIAFEARLQEDADVFGCCAHKAFLFGSTAPRPGAEVGGDAVIETEFDEKSYSISGAEDCGELLRRLAASGVGLACRKGRKASPNQDNVFFCRSGKMTFCGVADGHGDFGHWASHWVARYAAAVLAETVAAGRLPDATAIERVFNYAQEALAMKAAEGPFDVEVSGSTLTVCVIDHEANTMVTGWAGDSTAIRASGGVAALDVEPLSVDHNPKEPQERQRIQAAGGQICSHGGSQRVNPVPAAEGTPPDPAAGLAVTRALGDVAMTKCGVISRPAFKKVHFASLPGFVLVCSDGVWEHLSHAEAAAVIAEHGVGAPSEAAAALVARARERWLATTPEAGDTDDISAVVVWLQAPAEAAAEAG